MKIGIFFCLVTNILFAQQPNLGRLTDSLKLVSTSKAHDSVRVNALVAWDNLIYTSDAKLDEELNVRIKDLCLKKSKQKLSKKENLFFAKNLGFAYDNLGTIARYKGDSLIAIGFHKKGLLIRKKAGDLKGEALSNSNIAIVYMISGDYKKAVIYFTRSLKLREKAKDEKGTADCMSNIGALYIDQADFAKAREYYLKASKTYVKLKDEKGIATTYQNLGVVALEEGQLDTAIKYTNYYLDYAEKTGNKFSISMAYTNFGKIYAKRLDIDKALEYFQKSFKVKEEIGDKKGMVNCLYNISNFYNDKHAYAKSLEISLKSLQLATEMNLLREKKNAAHVAYSSYKNLGQKAKALEMFEIYIAARDSMKNDENTKALLEQEYTYKYEKQALADSLAYAQKKKLQQIKHDAELEMEKNFRYILYGGLLFVMVLGLVLLRGYRRKQKDNKIIANQKKEVELQRNIAEQKNNEILDSINYAKRIQQAILPPNDFIKEQFNDSFILYLPKDIVAGDFYWIERIGDKIIFAAADCTGHGVPGAMVSVVCHNALNRVVREFNITNPALILDKTRELVIEQFEKSADNVKDGMDISIGVLNKNSLEFNWAGANNPLCILRKGDDFRITNTEKELLTIPDDNKEIRILEIKPDKQPIGKYEYLKPFTNHLIQLKKNDCIFLFSDGYSDQFGGSKGKKFKYSNLQKLFIEFFDKPMQEQKVLLNDHFESWKGDLEQVDDVCVIGIRI
jgi:serine phosphatase RsbU (regulator of sigma subunit)